MHILKQYLKRERINQKDFAARLNISERHLSFILNGKSGVSLELALEIERETSGNVKAVSFSRQSA